MAAKAPKKALILQQLKPHKTFLTELAALKGGHKVQHLISVATDEEINAVLTLVHACTEGLIPVPQKTINTFIKSKKLPYIRTVFTGPRFEALTTSGRRERVKALLHIKSLLGFFAGVVV